MGTRSRFKMMGSIHWVWLLLLLSLLRTTTILQPCHSFLSPLPVTTAPSRIGDWTGRSSLLRSSRTRRTLSTETQNPSSEDLDASSSSLWQAKTRILQDMVQTLQHERDALRQYLYQLQQQQPNDHDEEVPHSTGTDWQNAYYQQWLSKPSTKLAWDAHIQEAQSQWETQHVQPLQQEIEHQAAKIAHLQETLLLVHSTMNQTNTTDSSTTTSMSIRQEENSTLLVAQQQQQEEWRLERETLEQECLELQRQMDQATAQIAAASASRTTTANQESNDTPQQPPQQWQERLQQQQRDYTQTWQARRVQVSEAKQIAKAAVRTAHSRAQEAVSTWHAAQQELFHQKQELQHLQQQQQQQKDEEHDKEQRQQP